MTSSELAAVPITRDGIASVELDAPGSTLQHALEARDAKAFTVAALATLASGHPFPGVLLERGAELLGDHSVLILVAERAQEPGQALLTAVQQRRLEPISAACALRIAGRSHPQEAARLARGLLRRALPADAEDLLVTLSDELGDPHLKTVIQREGVPLPPTDMPQVLASLARLATGSVLDHLPETAPREIQSGFTVQNTEKVGRNDACPCGSGKKYKKCCLGKPLLTPETWSAERLGALAGHELAGLDNVPEDLWPTWITELLRKLELDRAVELIEQLDLDPSLAVSARASCAFAQRSDLLDRLGVGEGDPLAARLRTSPHPFQVLENAARQDALVDLAYGALDGGAPGLAVHLLRGLLPMADAQQGPSFLADLLEARDQLGMDPIDPIEAHLSELAAWKKADKKRRASAEDRLRQELQAARTELARLRKEKKAEIVQEVVQVVRQGADPKELEAARQALADEKARHKLVHEERNALRRELKALAEEAETADDGVEQSLAEDAPDEPEEELFEAGPQPLRLPTFDSAFTKALGERPEHVQRAAIELVGRLAAGRGEAWHNARPLRGMREVWRVRLGRSYRMIFWPSEDTLRMIDLVHRQDLERRIKQLWRQSVGSV